MAVKLNGRYLGSKKVVLTHEESGTKMITDAPKDNQGEGGSFSPTDMLAGALGSCMMTIMAIVGERGGLDLSGMHMELEKHMGDNPRRIVAIPVTMHMPLSVPQADRERLETAAMACPAHNSLHPDIKVTVKFEYDV